MTQFPADLIHFIDNVYWIFAKTYADTWPHSYIVRDKVDEGKWKRGSGAFFHKPKPPTTSPPSNNPSSTKPFKANWCKIKL